MDEPKYFKAACIHCGNGIEFPETAVGLMVDCPHCGQRTQLRTMKKAAAMPEAHVAPVSVEPARASDPAPPGGSNWKIWATAGGVGVVAFVIGGFFFWKTHQTRIEPQAPEVVVAIPKPRGPSTNASVPASVPEPSPATAPATNSPATNGSAAIARPKSLSDLKAGEIQLEKASGSSLVYAVGQLDNDSDYQRFGVKIQLDVFNKAGHKLGTAQDYAQIIEPHKSWHFRALLVDSKAATAKVASITEDQ